MNDPASGVQQQLLPHVHLVSKSRYPVTNSLTMETAVDYLLAAPGVVRELQPMHWMFLDGPPDGTVMLVWQPLHHLGTNFASDGYVWADAEQAFTTEARGYTVEMWLHRSGYHPPNENVATHCRRRYRLTPSKTHNPNLPPCDPSLWIIHYSRAPATDHIPANRIPIVPQIQNILSQRRFLQNQGQLPRKDFMLHDRNTWPTINLPSQQGQQGIPPPSAYQSALQARQQQGAFYPQQGHVLPGSAGPTPSKPHRAARGSSTAGAGGMSVDASLEDEEVSTGDFLDLLTPREISKMRYKQHHEWMEEVFASPYSNKQIVPVDLGMGRKGELESLTSGYLNAASTASAENKDSNERTGAEKIAPEKVEEFTDRVTRRVADMNAEIEKMKRRHARRMEKVGRTKILKEAELKLRDAVADPSDVGTEVWRLEGRQNVEGDGSASPVDFEEQKPKYKVDDVVRELETTWGAKVIPNTTVTCVQKGGFLEKVEIQAPDEPMHDKDLTDIDAVMENADSHVRDQFGSTVNSPFGGQSTPFNESLAVADTSGTFNMDGAGDIPTSESTKLNLDQEAPPIQGMDIDVEMSGVLNDSITAPGNNNEDAGDWVMVGNEDEKTSSPKDENAQSGSNVQQTTTAAPAITSAAPTALAPATAPAVPPQVSALESTPAAPTVDPNVAPASTAAPTTSPAPVTAPAPAPASQPPTPEAPPAEAAPKAPGPQQEPQQQQQQQDQPTTDPSPAAPQTTTAPEQQQQQPTTNPTGDTPTAPSSDQQQDSNAQQGEQATTTAADAAAAGAAASDTIGVGDNDAGEMDIPEMENSAFGDAFHVSDTERVQDQAGEQEEGQEQQEQEQQQQQQQAESGGGEGDGQGQGQDQGQDKQGEVGEGGGEAAGGIS